MQPIRGVRRITLLLVALTIVLFLAATLQAHAQEFAGSITMMVEWFDMPRQVRVVALDYAWTDDLYVTALFEQNPHKGDTADLSVTYYIPFLTGVYATAGYRIGLAPGSERYPYVGITYRFTWLRGLRQ